MAFSHHLGAYQNTGFSIPEFLKDALHTTGASDCIPVETVDFDIWKECHQSFFNILCAR